MQFFSGACYLKKESYSRSLSARWKLRLRPQVRADLVMEFPEALDALHIFWHVEFMELLAGKRPQTALRSIEPALFRGCLAEVAISNNDDLPLRIGDGGVLIRDLPR